MAISVDRVYRTVLRILNKESRGTMQPDEFVKLGHQAQLELVDKAIYDYDNAINKGKANLNNNGLASIPDKIREKLDSLSKEATITPAGGVATLPLDTLRIFNISSTDRAIEYEEVSKNEASRIFRSPLTAPSIDFPLFFRKEDGNKIEIRPNVSPLSTASVVVDYIDNPTPPRWGYLINSSNGARVYDPNEYVSNGLVVKDDAFSVITSNISNGVDGTFNVVASISTGSTVPLKVTVAGNTVTEIEVVQPLSAAGSGFNVGSTLTVGTYIGTGSTDDLEVTGISSDLVITIQSTDLYPGSTAGSINFALHESEETDLVKTILAYSGILLSAPEITAQASQIMQSSEISKQQ